jgi:cytochrome d ubiquinol oxidase subunit II
VLCGIGLVLGYALLGAGWIILKTEGALQDWAWKRIPWLAGAALAVVCVAFIIALGDRDRIGGALHERTWGLVFPFIGLLAIYFLFLSLRLRPQALPFAMTVLFFVASFLTLAVMFWPYMIPYEITVAKAAAPKPRCLSYSGGRAFLCCRPSPSIRRPSIGCFAARSVRDMRLHAQAILKWAIGRRE